jgi:hypothetical protein
VFGTSPSATTRHSTWNLLPNRQSEIVNRK